AASLWSPRMRSAFPPQENIAQRFAQTRALTVQRVEILAEDQAAGQATVSVDLVEEVPAGRRHFVGNWHLVRAGDGWLLDQPDLRVAP
ncbi:MAG: hypothetical protein M3336_16730, partial [Chloroflexota bacterium]|nr:hypothetical protein [Chloroflexota bacterium]